MDSQPRVIREVCELVDQLPDEQWVGYPGKEHGLVDLAGSRQPGHEFVRYALIAFAALIVAPAGLVLSGLATLSIR